MWLDVEAARANVGGDPWLLWHMRLDARPDGPCPVAEHAHGCGEGVEVPGVGTFERFPGLYVTPRHGIVAGWHRHFTKGRTLRADPFLCWPATLAQALDALG